jgi:GT2 family glycosyltransferase
MRNDSPKISIILVNYNGKKLLEDCLSALFSVSYPVDTYEIIVVDNASSDGSVSYIKRNFPKVKLIELETNTGFTGGNNIGIEHASGEYIVLLNNDTIVEATWLRELVSAARPKNVGIVSSKLLFSVPYVKVKIKSSVVQQSEIDASTDFSPRGVLLEDIYGESSTAPPIWYKSGFHDPEVINNVSLRWTTGVAEVLLPISRANNTFTFIFHGYPVTQNLNQNVTLQLPNDKKISSEILAQDVQKITVTINRQEIKKAQIFLVQNAGNVVLSNGYSKDYGSVLRSSKKYVEEFYEEDRGQYDTKQNILAGCGAAMLIKREVIDQIGKLDGHYFMYYEDVEFCLRAWQMGWDIHLAPRARVYHHHRASTGKSESSFFIHMTERNHLFILFTHFPLHICLVEYLHFLLRLEYSIIKQFICKFKQWHNYPFWKQRMVGRLEACITFHRLLPSIVWKRLWLRKRYLRKLEESGLLLY